MSDAGAEESPEEAMTEAEEQAAMTEVQGAAATAMKAAQAAATAMANLAQAVTLWQHTASAASKKRREAERQSASLVKQMNGKIQEIEKWMEETTEGLGQSLSKEKNKLSNVADEKSPRLLPVVDQQGMTTPERKPKMESSKRTAPSFADAEIHSATPSKHQRTLESHSPLKTPPFPDSATQPTCDFFPSSVPSPSVPRSLDRRQSSLLRAVKNARMDDVLNYLEMDVDPNFWDEEDNTLLHVAVKSARSKILKVLLTRGRMQIDSVDSAGQTALHVAASTANGGTCIGVLVKQKADVNQRDGKGDTPLHCAARNGHELNVKKLIQAGADPSIANNDGEIPIHVAKTDGVRNLLQSQVFASLPLREHLDPSLFVSTSVDSANEIDVEDGEIFLD